MCWGPPDDTQHGLVLVEEWIDPSPQLGRDELLAWFAIRYFAGHGPATVADLAWRVLGYSDRSAPLAPERPEKITPAANGIFLPTIVAAGRVIGTWRDISRVQFDLSADRKVNRFTSQATHRHSP